MTHYKNTQNELNQFIAILMNRKWVIGAAILLMLMPFIYINQTQKPEFQSKTKLVYEINRTAISEMSYSSAMLGTIKLSNLIEEINSWTLMRDVVLTLPDSLLLSYWPESLPADSVKRLDLLTHRLSQFVNAQTIPKSDILLITARGFEPAAVQAAANRTAEILIGRNEASAVNEATTTRASIKDQLDYFRQKVLKSENDLKSFKEKENITNIEQQSQELFRRITEAEVEYNRNLTELNANSRRHEYLKRKLAIDRNNIVPSITTTTSPWIQQLKQRLVELEVQYTNLKVQNYSDRHPKLRALNEQIQKTKRNLREESLKIAKGERQVDPLSEMQQNMEEMTRLDVEIQTAIAKKQALEQVIQSYNHELHRLPAKELELGQLIRNKTVSDNIYTMLLEKYEESKFKGTEQPGNLRVIDRARAPARPISPNKKLNLAIGLFLGLLFGVTGVLLYEVLNQHIKSEEVVEKEIGLPVFSAIPRIVSRPNWKEFGKKKQRESRLITQALPNSTASESFKILRTNLFFSSKEIKTIAVTSSMEEEGKSFVAANLAVVSAQMGHRTLLIDADLRRPVQHKLFNLPRFPGLTHIFMRKRKTLAHKKEFVHLVTSRSEEDELMPFIHHTPIDNLFVTTSGKIPRNPSELLATSTMRKSINGLKKAFDIIIFDLPPVNVVTDPAILAKQSDAVLLVVRADKGKLEYLRKAKNRLDRVLTDQTCGVVLNCMAQHQAYRHPAAFKSDFFDEKEDRRKDDSGKINRTQNRIAHVRNG